MFGHFYAHKFVVMRNAAMCEHISPVIYTKNGGDGKQHGHPAVVRYVNRFAEIRRDLYHFF